MKASNFIIAMILIGVFASTFSLFLVGLTSEYSVSYDNDTLQVFEDTTELQELAVDLEEKTNDQNTESGLLDVVGNYISRAIDALKLSLTSFSLFESMATKAADKTGLPGYFLPAIISIMLVLLVIGVIISAMVKKDL